MNTALNRSQSPRNIIKFTFEKVTLNGVNGWLATKRTDGVFCGTLFGKTKKAAVSSFNFSDDYEEDTQ
jgi:hypothetical protein